MTAPAPVLRPAVIFDRDGTLASVAHVAPRNSADASWQEFNASLRFDSPAPLVAALLRSIRPGVARVVMSGRAEGDYPGDTRRRWAMQDWIAKHDLPVDMLLMRAGGDERPAVMVKQELYESLEEQSYDVRVVVEDHPRLVEMWEALGLYVLQVTDPEIPPGIGNRWGDRPE